VGIYKGFIAWWKPETKDELTLIQETPVTLLLDDISDAFRKYTILF
jgi:hypothetical protein